MLFVYIILFTCIVGEEILPIAQKYFKIDDAIISEKDIVRTDLQMMESLNVYKRAFQCVILFSIIVVK